MQRPKSGVYPIFDKRYHEVIEVIKACDWCYENPSITKTGRGLGIWRRDGRFNEELEVLKHRFEETFGDKAPQVKTITVSCYGRGRTWVERRLRVYINVHDDEKMSVDEIYELAMAARRYSLAQENIQSWAEQQAKDFLSGKGV